LKNKKVDVFWNIVYISQAVLTACCDNFTMQTVQQYCIAETTLHCVLGTYL